MNILLAQPVNPDWCPKTYKAILEDLAKIRDIKSELWPLYLNEEHGNNAKDASALVKTLDAFDPALVTVAGELCAIGYEDGYHSCGGDEAYDAVNW